MLKNVSILRGYQGRQAKELYEAYGTVERDDTRVNEASVVFLEKKNYFWIGGVVGKGTF